MCMDRLGVSPRLGFCSWAASDQTAGSTSAKTVFGIFPATVFSSSIALRDAIEM